MPSKNKKILGCLWTQNSRGKRLAYPFGISIVYSYMVYVFFPLERSMTWSPCVEIAWRCRTSESIQKASYWQGLRRDPICIWAYLPD